MTFQILCPNEIAMALSKKVSSDCEVKVFTDYDEQSISTLVSDIDILVSWLATKKIIEKGKTLKFIQCWGAGIDEIEVPLAYPRGIRVSNLAGFNSATVAGIYLMRDAASCKKINCL